MVRYLIKQRKKEQTGRKKLFLKTLVKIMFESSKEKSKKKKKKKKYIELFDTWRFNRFNRFLSIMSKRLHNVTNRKIPRKYSKGIAKILS